MRSDAAKLAYEKERALSFDGRVAESAGSVTRPAHGRRYAESQPIQ